MATINLMAKEVSFVLVYRGPRGSGKIESLCHIAETQIPKGSLGKVMPNTTPEPDWMEVDFLPKGLGQTRGLSIRVHVRAIKWDSAADREATRAMTKDADGVVFIADSQLGRASENMIARAELRDDLVHLGVGPAGLPTTFLYNKRDLSPIATVEAMNTALNPENHPHLEGVATQGQGVFTALKNVLKPALVRFIAS